MPVKIIYIILIFLLGCTQAETPKATDLVKTFFRQSVNTDDRAERFKKYTLDEQYEIFLFGTQVVHPPTVYLASAFAEQGAVIVPFLKSKLETVKNEPTIYDIVSVFWRLQKFHLYDVQKDADLMMLLENKVGHLKGPWASSTLEMLTEIKQEGECCPCAQKKMQSPCPVK